jgi:hypothetical protein
MSLSVFNVSVNCFDASYDSHDFCVVAKSEEDALRLVAGQYTENASNWGEESDEFGRDDFDTLNEWLKQPSHETAVTVEKVVDLDTISDGLVLSSDYGPAE